MSDLAQCFGFETISAEKLILAHFAEQLEIEPADSYRETTQGVRILLKNEPTLLTLPLLLDLVKKELEVQLQDKPVAAFLVDPMPNLPYMLPTKLQLNSCEQEMRHFENEVCFLHRMLYTKQLPLGSTMSVAKFNLRNSGPVCLP